MLRVILTELAQAHSAEEANELIERLEALSLTDVSEIGNAVELTCEEETSFGDNAIYRVGLLYYTTLGIPLMHDTLESAIDAMEEAS